MYDTPGRRAFSPESVSSQTYVPGQRPPLTISRLAIEGNAQHGSNSANVRIFLKLQIPREWAVSNPGAWLPLFAEDHIKIESAVVHPTDNSSAPYRFSTETSPLLHNTARALNLPSRLPRSYLDLFDSQSAASISYGDSSHRMSPARPSTLDERYVGAITISKFQVSYTLPRDFPSRLDSAIEDETDVRNSARRNRRLSAGERDLVHFIVGISLSVPLSSRPPKAPFTLSIPIPRCLSNTVKIRIHGKSTASSYASLSSDDGNQHWDITSIPSVTRTMALSRSNTYADIDEDDEIYPSDLKLTGTFPSSERLSVRWASPISAREAEIHTDGRHRVGIQEVRSITKTTILGSEGSAVRMRLEHEGTCRGVWFPGVATLLAMDVYLDNASEAAWSATGAQSWTTKGGQGFEGSNVSRLSRPSSRQSLRSECSSPAASPGSQRTASQIPLARSSSTSSASLLRVPLPKQAMPEYSFENPARDSESVAAGDVYPPGMTLTLHLDISELDTFPHNEFSYKVSGVVIIPTHDTLPIPVFRVIGAKTEVIDTTVRSETNEFSVDVLTRDGTNVRHHVLRPGTQKSCSKDSSIAIKSPKSLIVKREPSGDEIEDTDVSAFLSSYPPGSSSVQTVSAIGARSSVVPVVATADSSSSAIPVVRTSVTIFARSYLVQVTIPNLHARLFEFGIEIGQLIAPDPNFRLISITQNGQLLKADVQTNERAPSAPGRVAADSDRLQVPRWLRWVNASLNPSIPLNNVQIIYEIDRSVELSSWDDKRCTQAKLASDYCDVLLPTFSLPVSLSEVMISISKGSTVTHVDSSFPHDVSSTSTYPHLMEIDTPPYQRPRLTVRRNYHYISDNRPYNTRQQNTRSHWWILPTLLCAVLAAYSYHTQQELDALQRVLDGDMSKYSELHCSQPAATVTTILLNVPKTQDQILFPTKPAASNTDRSSNAVPPSRPERGEQSLLIRARHVPWVLTLQYPPIRETISSLLGNVYKALSFVQRIFHYPLDP